MSQSVSKDIDRVCETHPVLCESLRGVCTLEDVFAVLPDKLSSLKMVKQDEFSHDLILALEGEYHLVIGAG